MALLLAIGTLYARDARGLSLPRVNAELASPGVSIGRPVSLIVEVEHEAGSTIVWPKILVLGDDVEERGRRVEPTRDEGGILHSRAEFTLMAFDTGVLPLMDIEVGYEGPQGESRTLRGPALSLKVSGNVQRDNPSLRPMMSTRPALVRDWTTLAVAVVVGLALLVLVLGLAYGARRRRRADVVSGASQLPPHQEALALLKVIEASGRLDEDALKAVFHDMSEIVRGYLGKRFGFPALDQTSSEIHARLLSVPGSERWCDSVVDWLSECDLVKYAGSQVTGDNARSTLYQARLLIERTNEDVVTEGVSEEAGHA